MKRKPKLGQNFLVDDRARHAIADALGDVSRKTVIEIGPGRGAITDILVHRAGRLIALELDRELAPALAERYHDLPHVRVVEQDVLKTNFAELIAQDYPCDVIGNLPYYITSDILLKLFEAGRQGLLSQAVVMMQREVAERVAASPGNRDYGLLSATAQMNAHVQHMFTLPPGAFSPPPQVHSTVLRLLFAPRFDELRVDPPGFDRFLKQSFAQKRKTLINNLRATGFSQGQLDAHWPESVHPQSRAEALTLEQMAAIYHALQPTGSTIAT